MCVRGNLNLSTVRTDTTVVCWHRTLDVGECCASMSPSHTANTSLIHTWHSRVIVMECKVPSVCVVHAYAAQSQHPRPIATDRSRWHDGTSRLCSRNTTRGPCREHDTTMRYPQALHSAVVPLHRCRLVTIHTQELKAC